MNKSTPISQLPRQHDNNQPTADDDADDAAIQDVLAEINNAHNPATRQMQSLPIKPVLSSQQQQQQLQMQLQQLQQSQQQQFQVLQQQQQQQMQNSHIMPQPIMQFQQPPSMISSITSQLWENYFSYIVLFAIVIGAVLLVNTTHVEAFIVSHMEFHAPQFTMLAKAILTGIIVVGISTYAPIRHVMV
jgi:hypothetical protein